MAMDSSSRSLDTLPMDILELISEQLASCDSRLLSVSSLSLASRTYAYATRKQRFARINFRLISRDRLSSDVDRCRAILDTGGYSRYIRRVKITGCIPIGVNDSCESDYQSEEAGRIQNEEDGDKKLEQETWSGVDDRFTYPPWKPSFYHHRRRLDQELKRRQDESWQPLADLIKDLDGLKDLIYESHDRFPRCLLLALQGHPKIRLHMHSFDLRTLVFPKRDPSDVEPDELALLSTPSLHSLVVYSSLDDDEDNREGEAALQLVTRLASRLKHVTLTYHHRMWRNKNSAASPETAWTPPQAWLGFPGDRLQDSRPVGSLQSLALQDNAANKEALAVWSRRTDFTALRALELYPSFNLFEDLTGMAQDGQFCSLRVLALSFGGYGYIEESASLLLEALHPLESLTLMDYHGHGLFRAATRRHGDTLRYLRLEPGCAQNMSLQDIEELRVYCPHLRDLKCPVVRTAGDKQEAAFYRAIGRLPCLQRLTLGLHVYSLSSLPPFPSLPPIFSLLDPNRYTLDELMVESKMVMMNSAIDAKLARSIFRLISTAQSRNGSRPVLNHLIIEPRDLEDPPFDIDDRVLRDAIKTSTWLARTWICERDQWGDKGDDVSVREVLPNWEVTHAGEELSEWNQCGGIWRELWGRMDKEGKWKHQWKSLPLFEG
ncbi:hypothetical protein G6O67_005529 [Ophiocordyceps sinensis]|uniref:Uncharacterized protein n=2 Tax=Ophiocordyceps sinensis TaxID=72228 RepID=A0A8H4V610_9HYPO|nr:protein kinase subdomain-containing protein [Ophiocordyceps sinensis CO18]KAF4509254.1 hypothetical protein G6O67_005529 [Ophiocordyceps sinensis]